MRGACRDKLVPMPGALARYYQNECHTSAGGGDVRVMGKPAAVIYERALRDLNLQKSEILAVGDSIEHDITGAAAAGVDALFVAGGIHANECDGLECGALADTEGSLNIAAVGALHAKFGQATPRYAMQRLRW